MSDGLKHSTLRKYRNSLALLQKFCDGRALVDVTEIVVDTLDAFRASRGLSLICGVQELKFLRQFFKFCLARHWVRENPASQIKMPRNVPPNEVEPYTTAEVESMIAACGRFRAE